MIDETSTADVDISVIIEMTTEIVCAYVANNPVPASELPAFISSVHRAMTGLGREMQQTKETAQKPAVNPKKSVFEDRIVCLEDGKSFKSLKRHLMSHFSLTPDEYRMKWNLPADYPMVAPGYSAARSTLAKKMGLGRKAGEAPKKGRAKTKAA